jgi:hypothetical protein
MQWPLSAQAVELGGVNPGKTNSLGWEFEQLTSEVLSCQGKVFQVSLLFPTLL